MVYMYLYIYTHVFIYVCSCRHVYLYIYTYVYIYILIITSLFLSYRRILLQNKVTKMTLFLENKYGVSSSNEYVYKLPVSYRQSRRKSLSNLEKVRTYVCTFIYMYEHISIFVFMRMCYV
jgi:hypothetical protein